MPHAEETFYKMKCGWSADPKVASLARFGPVDACLARDLFGQEIDYARRELTNGLVPMEIIGSIAYPLPAEEAMRIAMHLADPGPYGPLCEWDATSNAFRILAYPKWNDTREEVQARKEKGSKAARARWNGNHAPSNAPSNAPGNARSMPVAQSVDASAIHRAGAQVDAEQEQEQEQEQDSGVQVGDQANLRNAPEAEDGSNDQPNEEYELDTLVQALMYAKTGRSVSRIEALSIRQTLLSGRVVRDRAAYLRSALSTKKDARAFLPTLDPPSPPPSSAVLRPRVDRSAAAGRGAAEARRLMAEKAAKEAANGEARQEPEPDPLPEQEPLPVPDAADDPGEPPGADQYPF